MAFQAFSLAELASQPCISALDVVRLQDALAFDGPVTLDEAQALFEIEFAPVQKHPSWKGLFIDAIAEHTIHDTAPHGYLTALKADWLLRQIAPQGRILTRNSFELLTTLLGLARWVPERLVAALLDEVYCAVAASNGPLREGTSLPPGTLTERDTDVVRHILYTAGSSGHGAITRVEAEGLLAIDAIVASSQPVAGWSELLAKAIGDAVLTASGHTGPIREVFLSPEGSPEPGKLINTLRLGFARYHPQTCEDRAIASLERQRVSIITGDEVRPATASWLIEALRGQQERPSVALSMLFVSLAEHRCSLDPSLQHLVIAERDVRAA